MKTRNATRIAASAGLLATALLGATACHGDREEKPPHQFFPDMDDSPKWKPQVKTDFFTDKRSMRQPVEGTVAYGHWDFDAKKYAKADWAAPFNAERADMLKDDEVFYRGIDESGRYVKRIPITVDAKLIARGQERFGIYCSVCHGLAGDGQGMVAAKWTAAVPTFHDPKYSNPSEPDQKGADGFLFYTALHGVPGAEGNTLPTDDDATVMRKTAARKMPGYAHALSERDAWAIVAYVRVLQESQHASLSEVPADVRSKLEDYKAKLPPPPPPPAAAPAAGAPKGKS